MGVITAELCEKKLKMWLEAEDAVATGASYKIGQQELKRADLGMIREQISYWEARLIRFKTGGGVRTFRVIPRDL